MPKKVDTTTQEEQVQTTPRPTATQLLSQFLIENKMRLRITPIKDRMNSVDDGSLIIRPSDVTAVYTDQE